MTKNVTYMKSLKASSLYSVIYIYISGRLINYFYSKSNYSSGGIISPFFYF